MSCMYEIKNQLIYVSLNFKFDDILLVIYLPCVRGAGAVARVTCRCLNELGNKTSPISVFSHATDGKGYYFATLSLAKLGSKLKINECKAYLESSPLNICKVPTNVNHGISGAPLSSHRLLENNYRLYTLPPFFYTSQAKPILNGS